MRGSRTALCASAAEIRFASNDTDASGVPLGANSPIQEFALTAGKPASSIVGTEGNPALRFESSTASGRTLPSP